MFKKWKIRNGNGSRFEHVLNPCDIAMRNCTKLAMKSQLVYTPNFEVATSARQKSPLETRRHRYELVRNGHSRARRRDSTRKRAGVRLWKTFIQYRGTYFRRVGGEGHVLVGNWVAKA